MTDNKPNPVIFEVDPRCVISKWPPEKITLHQQIKDTSGMVTERAEIYIREADNKSEVDGMADDYQQAASDYEQMKEARDLSQKRCIRLHNQLEHIRQALDLSSLADEDTILQTIAGLTKTVDVLALKAEAFDMLVAKVDGLRDTVEAGSINEMEAFFGED